MKVILLICMALFLGCQNSTPKVVKEEKSQITQKERQLDEKIAKIKAIAVEAPIPTPKGRAKTKSK